MSTSTPMASTAAVTRRWSAVGSSADPDPAVATRAALAAVTARGTPALVLLFLSPWRDPYVVAATAAEVLGPDVPVVGCTTAGEIADDHAGSGQVVALALGGDGFSVRTAVGQVGDGAREAGEAVARAIHDVDGTHRALMLLCDGHLGARAELVRGAYGVLGAAVPLVGGCAADEMSMTQTFQLHCGEVRTGAVVGVAIGSEAPIAIGVGHGWRRSGDPLLVTGADDQRILTLDDRPALDVYLEAVGPGANIDPASAWQHVSIFHPLGLTRPGGEEIRAVLGLDFAAQGVLCADVPQGTVVSMMAGDADTVGQGTVDACRAVLDQLGDSLPVALVAFDCAARRAVLGDDGIVDEVRTIRQHFPDIPLGGFYTQGEFARTRGARGVHNATLVLVGFA